MTASQLVADLLWRLGTFLLVTAWIVGSGWLVVVFGIDIYGNWGRWHTYPLPDKRAVKHLVTLLVLVGLWSIFLWLAVVWFSV